MSQFSSIGSLKSVEQHQSIIDACRQGIGMRPSSLPRKTGSVSEIDWPDIRKRSEGIVRPIILGVLQPSFCFTFVLNRAMELEGEAGSGALR